MNLIMYFCVNCGYAIVAVSDDDDDDDDSRFLNYMAKNKYMIPFL